MIVQPDFLDHWKTELLIDLLGDVSAPLYVIRLWAHCQNRKTQVIPSGNPKITKAICKASNHDAEKFHSAMIEAGFIEEIDGELIAHGWNDINASLIKQWSNGKKGGRPPKQNPTKTQTKPKDNPTETQSKPVQNRLDKSRLDKIRLDEIDDTEDIFPVCLSRLENDPTIENAIKAIYASNDSFATVNRFHIENALKSYPDRSTWYESIRGMAAKFAGVKMDFPNRNLENWLNGKSSIEIDATI